MLTREEWDMIARCVHCHPPSISAEQANVILEKLEKMSHEDYCEVYYQMKKVK